VFDFLNLEDVARLMMCSRSLREMGKENKDWKRAVESLSRQNEYDEDIDDIDDFFADGQVPDPRIKPGFASKPHHEQFGLLFVFQRDNVTNLLSCYDIENLDKCDFGREYFMLNSNDEVYDYWPGALRDMWKMHQKNFDSIPPRIVMLDRIAQLSLAQCAPHIELQAIRGYSVPDWWLEFSILHEDGRWENSWSDEPFLFQLMNVYNAAEGSGVRYCSDANFKQVGAPSALQRVF
jgi:hypothetical protein